MKALAKTKNPVLGAGGFALLCLAGLILVVMQSSLLSWTGLSMYSPEWVLIITIYFILRAELWAAVLGAFVLGFFRDSVGGWELGLYIFTLVLMAWLFYPFRSRLNFFNPLTLIPLTFILNLGAYLFVIVPAMAVLGWPGDTFNPLAVFLLSSLTTALSAPPLFFLLDWLTGRRRAAA